jgi:hypothetical protein
MSAQIIPSRMTPLGGQLNACCTRLAGDMAELAVLIPDAWLEEVSFIVGACTAVQQEETGSPPSVCVAPEPPDISA